MYLLSTRAIRGRSPTTTYTSNDRSSTCSTPCNGSFPWKDFGSPMYYSASGCRLNNYADIMGSQNCLVIQQNGQKIFGPPPNCRVPPRGCEVFVGKLPRDMMENEIIPIFAGCGEIYQLRLMMDFSGTNRGYAFVTYTTKVAANWACRNLNNFEIRPNRRICVVKSIDNCRLFMGKIPRHLTREEVKQEIEKWTEDVKDVIMYPHRCDRHKNRGFAFIEYESHKAATIARRKLIPARLTLWDGVAVDWAEPEIEPDEEIMSQVKILYVRNLALYTTETSLRRAFESAVGYATVERVKRISDYAFVHFFTREHALMALDKMNGVCLDGAILEIALARPPNEPITDNKPTTDIPTLDEYRKTNSTIPMHGEPNNSYSSSVSANFLQSFEMMSFDRQNPNASNPFSAFFQTQVVPVVCDNMTPNAALFFLNI